MFSCFILGIDRKSVTVAFYHFAGHSFCKAKISEIYQTSTPAGLSEVLIEKILWFLRQTEGLSRYEQTFVKALPSLEPDALSSLLLTPLILHDQVHEVNCLRYAFSPCCFFQCKKRRRFHLIFVSFTFSRWILIRIVVLSGLGQ